LPEGINQLIRERRAVVRVVEQAAKPIDTAVEKLQRRLKRLKQLRRKVPTAGDFSDILGIVREILTAVQSIDQAVGRAAELFGGQVAGFEWTGDMPGISLQNQLPASPTSGGSAGKLPSRPSSRTRSRPEARVVTSGQFNQVWEIDPSSGSLTSMVWEGRGSVPQRILQDYRVK
jgi:hypothetical protein